MITGVQVLSRTRFFLLFFVLALTTFEWQVLVAKEYGQEKGGAMLGLASSFGTLLTVLILALLTAFRRQRCELASRCKFW
jgi:ABC-type nickel/cobalt efflux system permease component RcnA